MLSIRSCAVEVGGPGLLRSITDNPVCDFPQETGARGAGMHIQGCAFGRSFAPRNSQSLAQKFRPAPTVCFSAGRGWVDAVAGGKFEIALSKKAFVTIFGDAGGASARDDYQVGGALGFRISEKWALQAGYRYMNVDYGSSAGYLYNVAQSGVVVGATWSVK